MSAKVIAALAALVCALSALAISKSTAADRPYKPLVFKPVKLGTHRLPTNVRPVHYDLKLDFIPSHLSTYPPALWEEYMGTVRIEVEFSGKTSSSKVARCLNKLTHHIFSSVSQSKCSREGKKNRIVLHADPSVLIHQVQVFKAVGPEGLLKEIKIAKLGADKAKQLITIDTVSELPLAGTRGFLEFTFSARTRNDKTGIYQSDSRVRGKAYTQIAAKFQPTFARLALPCFDEPGYKATFQLTIEHPAEYYAYSTTNLVTRDELYSTRGGPLNVVTKFKYTKRMSIHMFAFTVGNFDEPLEMQMRDNLRLRAITPKHKREAGAYALEVAKFAIEWFEKFIDYEFPLEKLDIVAFPDTDTDNTETWGLVFIRDILALVDDETKPDTRITTAVNVAHVVVHQWFANLITAEWWDDMWITESVAAQMAFEIVADLFPEQSEYFVRISTLSSILTSDSSGRNHSLSPPEADLSTSSQVYELFDNIQFMKSGALARLQQDTLGREKFQEALQKLVRRHAYTNIEFDDLIEVIAESETELPMEQILSSWATLKSYPVINVAYNKEQKSLMLYEEPRPVAVGDFVNSDTGHSHNQWVLPLKVLMSDASGERQEIGDVVLGVHITQSFIELPAWFEVGRDFVKVSPEPTRATYYRVRYSDELLKPLKEPVEKKKLATMDRLHLLDDSRALAAGSLLKPDTFKELLGWHATETDAAMIIEMLLATQTLGTLTTTDSTPSPASQVFTELFTKHGFTATGEETLLEQRARMVTLNALINRGVQAVIDAGVKAFEDSNGEIAALFLREPVYAAVVRAGTGAQVQKMVEHLERTESHEEQIRLANALARYNRNMDTLARFDRWLARSDLKAEEIAPIHATMLNSRTEAIKLRDGVSQ